MESESKKIMVTLESRDEVGKGSSRRVRARGKVPGVVYCATKEPVHVQVDEKQLHRLIVAGVPVVDMCMPDGAEAIATVKEVQYDPLTDLAIHVDFQEVREGDVIEVFVTLITVGECPGAKKGGVLEIHRREVAVRGKPADLPEHLTVDVSSLEIGDSIKLREIAMPEGVELAGDPDFSVLSVVLPTRIVETPVAEVPVEAVAEAAEAGPQVEGKEEPRA